MNEGRKGDGKTVDKILVVGSLNMDFVIEVDARPLAGETVLGKRVALVPGGKGANQAYAAARLGGDVRMIGAVGDDVYGRMLKENLELAGVDTSGVETVSGVSSGNAFITVDSRGENMTKAQLQLSTGPPGVFTPYLHH